MTFVTNYKVRSGKPIPALCNITGPATHMYIYMFGSETQDVLTCTADDDVARSIDMCLFNEDPDALYRASYRALPNKVEGKLIFNSTLEKIPVITNTYRRNCFDF